MQQEILDHVPNECTVFLICHSTRVPLHPLLTVCGIWNLPIQNAYQFIPEHQNCFVLALQTVANDLGIFFFCLWKLLFKLVIFCVNILTFTENNLILSRKKTVDFLDSLLTLDMVKNDSYLLTKSENDFEVAEIGGLTLKWWLNLFGSFFVQLRHMKTHVCFFFLGNLDQI